MATRVILLMRAPQVGQYSMERVFEDVCSALPADIDVTIVRLPFESRGIVRRVRNLAFTARLQPEVVHVTGDVHYCCLAVRRKRCVLTVHDLSSLHRLVGLRKQLYFLCWFRLPTWWAARITTVSRATRDELLRSLPGRAPKVSVVPNPVKTSFLVAERAPAERRLARVLVVGTAPNKNLERVVTALEGAPVQLRIVGPVTSHQRHQLQRSGLAYEAVERLSDDELIREYTESDLLVFVSTYEGFGLPIVEAQAAGLPVVTSDLSAMRETAGDGALLVDPFDVLAIRDAVARLLDSSELARSLVEKGRRNAEHFSPPAIAALYARIYRDLASHL